MDDPRWLTDQEQHTWQTYMVATRLLIDRLEEDLRSEAGIAPGYYELLVLLAGAPGNALRMTELASRSTSKPSRISHAVNRLEEMGWIRREHCAADRRGWSAVLTDEGRHVLEKTAPAHVRSVRANLIDLLTAEQVRQLGEISDVLLKHLSADDT
ncbi:MarR family transcriptional regulator [Dactylosporangium sp. NPDC051484]|uniref:MarR family winged helix-turn-helix transcriptional regulator n=1 Tax=Dactylosporangium sp. NPDC051484 TaxID=3154942 RepID=UPI003450DFB5